MKPKNEESSNGSTHLFKVGQTVQKKGTSNSDPATFYRITGTLPSKGNSPQYRMKSYFEHHERVIIQDLIELVSASPTDKDETLIEQTFRNPRKQSAKLRQMNTGTMGIPR